MEREEGERKEDMKEGRNEKEERRGEKALAPAPHSHGPPRKPISI